MIISKKMVRMIISPRKNYSVSMSYLVFRVIFCTFMALIVRGAGRIGYKSHPYFNLLDITLI